MTQRFIGIEAGGTKFVCAHGTSPKDMADRVVIPTQSPDITIPKIFDYIRTVQKKHEVLSIGLGIFGPIDLNPSSKTCGYITTTPKKEWQYFDMAGTFKREFKIPVGFEVDVNASAMGEYRWGRAKNLSDFIYVTIGTGIGGGAMVGKQLLHGTVHAEMGHILIPQNIERDPFSGVCPNHNNCLEGLASGPALCQRWNVANALEIPADHFGWELEADYLATAMMTYTLCFSPQKIILGGGVMRQQHLLDRIKPKMQALLNNYIQHENILRKIDNYLVTPGLGEDSGICGAIALAELAWQKSNSLVAQPEAETL